MGGEGRKGKVRHSFDEASTSLEPTTLGHTELEFARDLLSFRDITRFRQGGGAFVIRTSFTMNDVLLVHAPESQFGRPRHHWQVNPRPYQ